jgi:branched-chain amino acid transport system substrate-binding protein
MRAMALWVAALTLLFGSGAIRASETIELAVIEPLSGPFANIGTATVSGFRAAFDRINDRGGVLGKRFVIVPFDNKSSPQDSTLQVQAAIDRGIRYIMQGAGSNNGHAVSDAIAKHNSRNPQTVVLHLNHGSLDPALTDEKCHAWHFRFVPHGHMIMKAVVDAIARNKAIRSVYLVNQDYVWGHSVAKDTRDMLAVQRPDVRIVGADLHPIGKVKDFAPYIANVRAAGADAIVTGNWGNDLALLIRAARNAGLAAGIYAPLAGLTGAPSAMREAGVDKVRAALFWHENIAPNPLIDYALAFRSKYGEDWNWLPNYLVAEMLAKAMTQAGSIDPLAVAPALENMRHAGPTGEVWMRPEDHQLMMPIFQTVFKRVGEGDVKYDSEGTGFGWKTEGKLDTPENIPPLLCKIRRQ